MSDFETHAYGTVAALKERIFELESGACRFNCRAAKEAFMAGYDYGMDQDHHFKDRHNAYQDWCDKKA